MAGRFDLGAIGKTGTATGPHGHLYVKDLKTGEYINPDTIKSALTGIKIGKNEQPLVLKGTSGQLIFNPAFPRTSGFGKREAPTAGASTDHQGIDIGLPEGTPVKMLGYGKYLPVTNAGGFGNLATFRPSDGRYEIGMGHMSTLGREAQVYESNMASQPKPPVLPAPVTGNSGTTASDNNNLNTLLLAALLSKSNNTKNNSMDLFQGLMKEEPSVADQFIGGYLKDMLRDPYA